MDNQNDGSPRAGVYPGAGRSQISRPHATQAASTSEDTPVTIPAADLLANDTDAEGDTLSLTSVGNAVNGTVALDVNGDVVFTPAADFEGTATFDYTVLDSYGGMATQTVTVDITPVNDAPVAVDSLAIMPKDTIVNGRLTAIDVDDLSSGLTFTGGGVTENGQVVINPDGTYTYTPNSGFSGTDSFTFQVSDPSGLSDTGQVSVSVDPPAGAAPSGPEFQVNTYTPNAQDSVSVAALSDGGFVVSWESYLQDGSFNGIYGQRYDAAGETVGPEFQANSFTSSGQTTPSVTGLSDGGFVLTWRSDGQEGSLYEIWGQRFDVAGNPAGGEFHVNTYTTSNQDTPSVAALSDGGFVVTWESFGQGGSKYEIWGQRFDAAGSPVGSEFHVNTYTSANQKEPSVAGLSDGGFVVTWQSKNQGGSRYEIWGQHFDVAGNPAGGEFHVNTNTSEHQNTPSVAALSSGGFVVTWESFQQDGSGDGVFGQRFDTSGVPVGSEFQVNSVTSSDQREPSVDALSDGGFVVTWHSRSQDGSGYGIYGQQFDSIGNPVGTEFQVNEFTSGDQDFASVAALPDGGFAVAWESYGQDGDNRGVYARVYSGALVGSGGNDTLVGDQTDNTLIGVAGDDTLAGSAGNDVLKGGVGNDDVSGGTGDDIYEFDRGDGQDVVDNHNEGASSDQVLFGTGVDTDQLWFEHLGNDLEVSIIGTEDRVTVDDWYVDTVHRVAEFETADGSYLKQSSVEILVSAMAAFAPPAMGETELSPELHTQLDSVIAANWQPPI